MANLTPYEIKQNAKENDLINTFEWDGDNVRSFSMDLFNWVDDKLGKLE